MTQNSYTETEEYGPRPHPVRSIPSPDEVREMTVDQILGMSDALEMAGWEEHGQAWDEAVEEVLSETDEPSEAEEEFFGDYGRLVTVDSPEKAELRELEKVTVSAGNEVLQLDYDEGVALLDQLSDRLLKMKKDRLAPTCRDYCPLCELDAYPAPPLEMRTGDGWAADIQEWLREEFDYHVAEIEAEEHYGDHMYNGGADVSAAELAGDKYGFVLDGEVVEMKSFSTMHGIEDAVRAAKERRDELEDIGGPTATQEDVVGAVVAGGEYTAAELADEADRSKRSVYNNMEGLVRAGVLVRLGGRPERFRATGDCAWTGLEVARPADTTKQDTFSAW